MMHEQGVLTSVNSDSADLSRRLNTEAAKSMKYGNLAADDALKFVTINAARSNCDIDNARSARSSRARTRTLSCGTVPPLSNYTRAEQTWIDGRKYFDRAEDAAAHMTFAAQRETLVQKALAERRERT